MNAAIGEMDRVTQRNAVAAGESAAAAQELNAQAEMMKQSVAELLCLVGGRRHSPPSALTMPVAAAGQLPDALGIHRNGNGHSVGKLGSNGTTSGRTAIPLETDFVTFR
jgi:hypothetical protein